MNLAAPLFLLGLAAIALPVWLHRLRLRAAERQPFSSAMLLTSAVPQLQLRKRWRYRALMALRMLLLAALCGAFAQPVWQRHSPTRLAPASLQLVVIDTSLSMGADGRLERARAEARRIIDRLGVGQRALIVTASDGLEAAAAGRAMGGAGPSADPAALRAALARLRPGVARLDYGAAMAGLDSILGTQRGLVEAHFISDFQGSGMPTRFGELLPAVGPTRTLTLQLHPVELAGANGSDGADANWAISSIGRSDGDSGSGGDIDVMVRGFDTPARQLEVTLELNGAQSARISATVPAAGATQFRFQHPLLRIGDNRIVARLSGIDALAADNVRYAVIRSTPAEPVPLLSVDPAAHAAKYLSTALAAAGGGYQAQPQALVSFDARALPRYRWVMIDDLGAVDDALAAQLRAFVVNGGAIFAALGEGLGSHRQVPLLGDALVGNAGDGNAGEGAGVALTVGQVDASHPLLAGLRGWESLSIGHMRVVAPGAADQVLVSASDGAPLLLERRLGRGRIVLFTSDLNDDWNDLPVQPLFVGLLAQMGRYLGGRGEFAAVQTVGASLALGRDGGPAGQLIDPSGRTVLSLTDTRRALTVKLDQTGFYQIYTPGAGEALVAVNPDPRESDLTPVSANLLARWRNALAAARGVPRETRAAAANHPAVPLAPTLLVLLVLLVLAESLLGNSYLQRRRTPGTS